MLTATFLLLVWTASRCVVVPRCALDLWHWPTGPWWSSVASCRPSTGRNGRSGRGRSRARRLSASGDYWHLLQKWQTENKSFIWAEKNVFLSLSQPQPVEADVLPLWAWFWLRFLPIKRESFLATVAKCCSCGIVGSLYIKFKEYSLAALCVKCLEMTFKDWLIDSFNTSLSK